MLPSYTTFLAESLNSTYPYLQTSRTGDTRKYLFTDEKENKYLVTIGIGNETKFLSVSFQDTSVDNYYKTGKSANAMKVFSTVGHIIREVIGNGPLKTYGIYFSANKKETSRTTLYKRLAAMLARATSGTFDSVEGYYDISYYVYPAGYKPSIVD